MCSMSPTLTTQNGAEIQTRGLVDLATPAEDAYLQCADIFFQLYSSSLLNFIKGTDFVTWCSHLNGDFVSIDSSGVVTSGADLVMNQWYYCLAFAHYSAPTISRISLLRDTDASRYNYECVFNVGRCYSGRHSLSREMLILRVTASFFVDGRWRVIRHVYQPFPPVQIRGIRACSQICQDLWVLKFFSEVPNGGFFLEIGANHPEELSNTFLLEKAYAWKGVCIDPFPVGDWSGRLGAELVRNAVGPDGSKLSFIAPGNVLGGLVDQVDLPRVIASVAKEEQRVVEVDTRSIGTVLRQARPGGKEVPGVIHYLSLDTEGSEYDILSSFPFDAYKVLSMTVEHNFKEPARTQIRSLLESHGFFLDMSVEHDDFFLLAQYQDFL